tara:strand:+ start:391 stop:576 length:186 start_codon:yes stop_codon:yes gene_type:complete
LEEQVVAVDLHPELNLAVLVGQVEMVVETTLELMVKQIEPVAAVDLDNVELLEVVVMVVQV